MGLPPVEVVMQNRRRRFLQFYNTGFCWAGLIVHNNATMHAFCCHFLLYIYALYLSRARSALFVLLVACLHVYMSVILCMLLPQSE